LSTASDIGALDAAVVLLGIGGAAVNQTTNTLVADLYREAHRKSVALNILGVFFGFVALFVPFTIGSLLRSAGLENILSIAGLLTLVPVALSLPFSFPAVRQRGGQWQFTRKAIEHRANCQRRHEHRGIHNQEQVSGLRQIQVQPLGNDRQNCTQKRHDYAETEHSGVRCRS
jgi:MFS family permease